MPEYRYVFEKYTGPSSRGSCPKCKKKRHFVHYIDTRTGERLDNFGKCNNELKCGYWRTPSMKEGLSQKDSYNKSKPVGSIPYEIVKETLKKSDFLKNHLVLFLYSKFDKKEVDIWCERMFIGTNRKTGATIFWHCDINWNFKQGQVVDYLPDGHRDKSKTPNSASSMLLKANKISNEFDYEQCCFGEHLLREDKGFETKNIGFFESPKTALICAISNSLELDTYVSHISMRGLSEKKVYPIKNFLIGKNVYLFNDYHFQARMVNGIMPMRIKGEKMDLEGNLKEDYLNKYDLLKMITRSNSNISFVDSPDGIKDESGNDIADIIIESPEKIGQIKLEKFQSPNLGKKLCSICGNAFSRFFIQKIENTECCINCAPLIYIPTEKEKSRPSTDDEKLVFLEKKNPLLSKLIKTFELVLDN